MSYQGKTKQQLISEIDNIRRKLYIGPRSKKNFIGSRLNTYILDEIEKEKSQLKNIQALYLYVSNIKDIYKNGYNDLKKANEKGNLISPSMVEKFNKGLDVKYEKMTDKQILEQLQSQQVNRSRKLLIDELKNPYFKKDDFKFIIQKFKPVEDGNYYKRFTVDTSSEVIKYSYNIKNKNTAYEDKIEQLIQTIKYLLDNDYKNKDILITIKYFVGISDFSQLQMNTKQIPITINETGDHKNIIINNLYKRIYWSEKHAIKSDAVFVDNYLINPDEFFISAFKRLSGGCVSSAKYLKNKFCVSYSYKSTNDNCLLEILRNKLNLKDTCNQLRKKIKTSRLIKQEGKLDINDIKIIENYYKIKITVYLDEMNEDETNLKTYYDGNKTFTKQIKILLNDNHYSELINTSFNLKQIEKQKIEKAEDFEFVFFDYETVNDNTELKPYFITIECNDKIYNIPENKDDVLTFDYDLFNKSVLEILNKIYQENNKKLLLIGYNSSRFDNFIIFDELLNNEISPNLLYVNNSILTLETSQIKTFDLCRFVMSSLKDACNAFKTKNKKIDGFDHTIPQNEYNNGNLKNWMFSNYEKILEYCNMDVLALKELFFTLREKILELSNNELDIVKYPTLSSSARDYWSSTYKYVNIIKEKINNPVREKKLEKLKFREEKYRIKLEEQNKLLNSKFWGFDTFKKIVNKINSLKKSLNIVIKKIEDLNNGFEIKKTKKKFYQNAKYDFNLPVVNCETIKDNKGNDNYIYDFIRSALTAGRSQMFKIDNCKEPIKVIDATSLYPFVMEGGNENLNFECFYPCGEIKKTDKYIEGKLGFYYCDIVKQPKKNIIPLRSKNKPLDWFYDGEIKNIVLCSVDIELIKKYGEIKIYNGVYFTDANKNVFVDYIQFFKNEKIKQDELKEAKDKNYNPALRSICKLYLNSLSGKVIENLHEEEFILSKDNSNLWKKVNKMECLTSYEDRKGFYMVKGKKKYEQLLEKNKIPHYLGVFIYAYARKWMYENIIHNYFGYGMDTDSYFMPESEFLKLQKDKPFIFGSEFGQFKVENYEDGKNKNWNNSYFIAPKLYALYDDEHEENNKTRFKGIRNNDKILSKEQYKEFNEIVTEDKKFEYFEKLDCVSASKGGNTYIKKEVFEKLYNKEKLYIVSNMINKTDLNIKNVYIIKKFNQDKKGKVSKIL